MPLAGLNLRPFTLVVKTLYPTDLQGHRHIYLFYVPATLRAIRKVLAESRADSEQWRAILYSLQSLIAAVKFGCLHCMQGTGERKWLTGGENRGQFSAKPARCR